MTDQTPFAPVIRTQTDLQEVWHHLMGPWGVEGHSIWLMAIGPDDRPIPQLTEITDTVEPPDEDHVLDLAAFLLQAGEQAAPGTRLALLRSRPGPDVVTAEDRAWAAALYAAGRRAQVPVDVVHRATLAGVVPIPMDDALGAIA
jgi:hypothetical protein